MKPSDFDEKFVKSWQGASSVSQVAKALDMPYWAACSYASRLRKMNIDLKCMNRRKGPRKERNIAALNKLAKASLASA